MSTSSTITSATEYIGRHEELVELRDHLTDAVGGHGSLVLLGGEPGIGKTRTCEEIAEEARRLALIVAWGRCWEGRGASPFWPWVQVLRQLMVSVPSQRLTEWSAAHSASIAALLPERRQSQPLAESFDSPAGRFQLFQGVFDIIHWATASAPLVLFLEDLQGADEGSLLLLDFVARQISAAPVLIVATYRDVATSTGAPLATRLPELTRESAVCNIMLKPLDLSEVESFVGGALQKPLLSDSPTKLHKLTEGNPLLLLECLRVLGSEADVDKLSDGLTPLPTGIRNAVRRHLAPLSADCRAILRAAAVFGAEFGLTPLRDLLGFADEMLLNAHIDESLDVGILTTDATMPGRYRFVHRLVREALYAELSNVELLRYHHDAGATLASRLDADANVVQITQHFVAAARRGANPEPAVNWARRAGDKALGEFDYEEAERLYALGIDTLAQFGPRDDRLHAELLVAHGNACNRLGAADRAKKSFDRAAELARKLGSGQLLALAALGYGGPLAFPEGGYVDPHYVALLESALERCDGSQPGLEARLLSRQATALYFADQATLRRDLCRRALQIARDSGDSDALGHVLLATHAALWGPNPDERLALVDELLHLIARTGDRSLAFAAHRWRYCDLIELGDVAGMEDEFQACRALAEELREPGMLGWVGIFRAAREMWAGRFEECERLMNENLVTARTLGNAVQTAYFLQLYHLRTLQGRCDEMLELMRMAAGRNPAIPAFAVGLAHVHVEAGRLDEARPLAADVVARLDQYPVDVNYISTLTYLGFVCARIGDQALVAPVYELMRPYENLSAAAPTGLAYCGSVAHWLGVMATSLQRFEDAKEHFDRALAAEAAIGSPPWSANTQCEYATMLIAKGEVAEQARAAALLAEAETTATSLGMDGLRDKCRTMIAGCDAPPSPSVQSEDRIPVESGRGLALYRREGDFWTIEHDGHTSHLRDSRGLRYLAQLLQHPHREFLVIDLAAEVSLSSSTAANGDRERLDGNGVDVDTVVDRKAVVQYRRRLEEVRAELCEAEANNDTGRASILREEMEALVSQLSSAVGLGGRHRPMSSDLERARSAVTKRIRDTLRRIQEENPQLGRHLAQTVQTGYFCAYAPAPHDQIHWSF